MLKKALAVFLIYLGCVIFLSTLLVAVEGFPRGFLISLYAFTGFAAYALLMWAGIRIFLK